MEKKLEIKHVPFMGTELMAARDEHGDIWAGVRWMCNGIGLSRGQINGEIAKAKSDEVLKEGCTKFHAGVFDPNNTAVALKLDFVPLWLAKISITPAMKEETPALAETLKQYQLRAKDVLASAFLPKEYGGSRPCSYPPKSTSAGEVASLLKVLVSVMRENRQPSETIAETAKMVSNQFGIDLPDNFVKRDPFVQFAIIGLFPQ